MKALHTLAGAREMGLPHCLHSPCHQPAAPHLPLQLLNPGAAIAISVTAVFIFGEVLPQVAHPMQHNALPVPLSALLCCNSRLLFSSHQGDPDHMGGLSSCWPVVAVSQPFLLPGPMSAQAVFARHGLYLGARLIWVVRIAKFLCWPIAWPGGKLLDRLLGANQVNTFK
jgi:hypothetical protein